MNVKIFPCIRCCARISTKDLEKRVRSLVDGYRELNDLVDNAPTRVMDAASQYAQALGVVPVNTSSTSALGDEDIGGQARHVMSRHVTSTFGSSAMFPRSLLEKRRRFSCRYMSAVSVNEYKRLCVFDCPTSRLCSAVDTWGSEEFDVKIIPCL